jgi:tetratricopeptide (TPR) repeat protein
VRRTLSAIAAGLALLTASVHTQSADGYAALVRMYADGSGADALAALLRRPHADVINASKVAGATLSPREMIAAAMLHTEAALSVVDARPFDAAAHADVSQTFRRAAARDADARERALAVSRRWYYFVASLFVSANQMQQASWYIRDGLNAFPREAALYFVRGTIAEMSVQMGSNRDPRRELPENSRDRARVEGLLKRAVDDYQHALSLDRHFAPAHLHIGWTRLVLGDNRARLELAAAAADARSDRTRYLAHLFLGGIAERGSRLDEARQEYQAALEVGAGFQTAYLALSRVEEALGNTARARELARICAELQKTDPDPWWDFVVNFDRDALNDLRAEVRRP